ncbi:SDR family oxidoreductase [Candidatus Giovannonibacteria bacterium]|nr:SDR family oxidoreductase [Candidatus Giovannonibacteria bacterium]
MELKDKVALVTGGSSGIGRAITLALAREGCHVVFTYNSNEEGADEVLKQVGGNGTKFKVDMRNEESIKGLFDFTREKFRKLDILVNNAGINRPRDLFDPGVWQEIFQVNLFAMVSCVGKAAELMGNGGKILNISSIYGDAATCQDDLPAYGASKAAVNHFTRMMAKNLAPKILVNAIAPGYVKTPLWKGTTEEDFEKSGREQLIERMILPEEIAAMALATIKNDAVTGEVMVVDGGLSLKRS